MAFTILNLADPILRALKEEGYTVPTPIQAKAIPPILEGRDVLGCAQTGTGKTAAFALPILHRLLTAPADKTRRGPAFPRALILSPTRELATQIGESFATYGRHTGLVHTCIFGGVSQFHQVRALHRGVDILVATPGRLEDLMEQRVVNLSEVRTLILDEADRMLDMGFIQPIRRIAAALPNGPDSRRHTLLFSATMPKEIMHLADALLKDPVKVSVTPLASAVPLITQSLYMVSKNDKQTLLHHLLGDKAVERAVVFTKTKFGADRVSRKLRQAGIKADEIHGNKAQNQRQRALDAFRAGRTRVLVATDVAARGLDVDAITHVFNFDMPMEPESYVHRIGRTGRAGATGLAVSFCDKSERGLLREVERLTGKPIPALPLPQGMERVDGSPDSIDSFNNANAKRAPSANAERAGRGQNPRQSNDQGRGRERWGERAGNEQRDERRRQPAPRHASAEQAHPHAKRDLHAVKPAPRPNHAPASAPKPVAPPAPRHAPAPKAHAEASHAPRAHRMPMTDPIAERPEKSYDYSRMIAEQRDQPRPQPRSADQADPTNRHHEYAHGFKKPFNKRANPDRQAARADRGAPRDDRSFQGPSRDPRNRNDARPYADRHTGARNDGNRRPSDAGGKSGGNPGGKSFAKRPAPHTHSAGPHPLARPQVQTSSAKPASVKKSNTKPHRKGAAPARPFADGKHPGHRKSRA